MVRRKYLEKRALESFEPKILRSSSEGKRQIPLEIRL
jgi:hypothetical protein